MPASLQHRKTTLHPQRYKRPHTCCTSCCCRQRVQALKTHLLLLLLVLLLLLLLVLLLFLDLLLLLRLFHARRPSPRPLAVHMRRHRQGQGTDHTCEEVTGHTNKAHHQHSHTLCHSFLCCVSCLSQHWSTGSHSNGHATCDCVSKQARGLADHTVPLTIGRNPPPTDGHKDALIRSQLHRG
jgi:hypothetical protein